MNPLTLDCALARQQLDERLEGTLSPEDEAALQQHLASCANCQRAQLELERAMAALASLSPEDLERLRAPLRDPELDAGSLTGALAVGLVVAALVAVAFLFALRARAPKAQPAPPPVVAQAPAFPLPVVGGEVGVEEDPRYEALDDPAPFIEASAAGGVVEEEPEEVVVAAAPGPVAPAPPQQPPGPQGPAPQPQPKQPEPQPVAKAIPQPLPAPLQALLGRLQLSDGLRYRGVTFFFLRDPEGRDRLSAARSQGLVATSESRPRAAEQVVVRAPAGRTQAFLLLGELLDAPEGLRIVPTTRRINARTELEVEPVRYDPLAERPKPILKGPVILPSTARLALVRQAQPGAVAVFLQSLADPRFQGLERLRTELGEVEAEARDLERRLRAIVGDTRGLRGVGVTIDGLVRGLDLFGSGRMLTASLGKLLRSALLEARLNRPYDQDNAVDPRSAQVEKGIQETRDQQRALLKLLARATQAPLRSQAPRRAIDARFEATDADGSAGVLMLQEGELVHALAAVPTAAAATKR
ncbi:MAG: zf-HC2 domain-containing protein [Planctomycetota bacterium]